MSVTQEELDNYFTFNNTGEKVLLLKAINRAKNPTERLEQLRYLEIDDIMCIVDPSISPTKALMDLPAKPLQVFLDFIDYVSKLDNCAIFVVQTSSRIAASYDNFTTQNVKVRVDNRNGDVIKIGCKFNVVSLGTAFLKYGLSYLSIQRIHLHITGHPGVMECSSFASEQSNGDTWECSCSFKIKMPLLEPSESSKFDVSLMKQLSGGDTFYTRILTLPEPISPVQEQWFNEIKTGRKTIEVRAGPCSKYDEYTGKCIQLHSDNKSDLPIGVKIVSVEHYSDLESCLNHHATWKKAAPQADELREAGILYANIRSKEVLVFSEESVRAKGGINAITIELM